MESKIRLSEALNERPVGSFGMFDCLVDGFEAGLTAGFGAATEGVTSSDGAASSVFSVPTVCLADVFLVFLLGTELSFLLTDCLFSDFCMSEPERKFDWNSFEDVKGVPCPKCKGQASSVSHTIPKANETIERRRVCKKMVCGHAWWTTERSRT